MSAKARDPWIGVDLDGTLAEYHGWPGDSTIIGPPIKAMANRVLLWLAQGKRVKIFTARVDGGAAVMAGDEEHCKQDAPGRCLSLAGRGPGSRPGGGGGDERDGGGRGARWL